jgi:predicted kinase
MTGRLTARRDDASDATPEVLRRQLEADLGNVSWRRLDAFASREAVIAAAEHILSDAL